MKKYYLIIAIVACFSANCSSQKAQSTSQNLQANEAQTNIAQDLQADQIKNAQKQKDLSLENTKWILKTVDGIEIKQSMNPAYITFNDDRVSGFSGCNSFSGTYYLSGSVLKLDGVISTMRGCIGDNPERLFFSVLHRVDGCMIVGNKLIMTQMNEEIATFGGTVNLNFNSLKLSE